MAQEFSPSDFEPLYQQALVLTIAVAESAFSLTALQSDLTLIHTQLSSLITKAENPNSLLRKRCSDRHGDWLQISYDLSNTLCEAQDIVNGLPKREDGVDVIDILEVDVGLDRVQEELSTHAFLIGEFSDSLGLSKVARKDPALGEIERILIDAAREERERSPERIAEEHEVNRLGGQHRIQRLLRENGVDRREIQRLDTRIKQVLGWVFTNEPELTMIRDLEGFGGGVLKEDTWSPAQEYSKIGDIEKEKMSEDDDWFNTEERKNEPEQDRSEGSKGKDKAELKEEESKKAANKGQAAPIEEKDDDLDDYVWV